MHWLDLAMHQPPRWQLPLLLAAASWVLVRDTGASIAAVQADFASLCANSARIRDGYGCEFSVAPFHPRANGTTRLRDVCPGFTLGQCSPAMLSLVPPLCEPGTYDSSTVAELRFYRQGQGASPCVGCPAGTHDHDGDAATACTSCPSGRYSTGRALLCFACAAGRRSAPWSYNLPLAGYEWGVGGQMSALGSASCLHCAAGTFAPPQSATCNDCSLGQYDHDHYAGTACVDCPPGQYSPSSNVCAGCVAGMHDDDSSALTPCSPCPAAVPSNATGTGFAGTFTAGNKTICHECAAGMSDSDFNPATPCCPILCRDGCRFDSFAADPERVLTYPGDCLHFAIYRSSKTSGATRRIIGRKLAEWPAWLQAWLLASLLLSTRQPTA